MLHVFPCRRLNKIVCFRSVLRCHHWLQWMLVPTWSSSLLPGSLRTLGVKKGYSIPGSKAGISTKHTLAITNRGGATAAEVVGLATYVQAMVQSHFGIILYPEPNLIGVEI